MKDLNFPTENCHHNEITHPPQSMLLCNFRVPWIILQRQYWKLEHQEAKLSKFLGEIVFNLEFCK